MSTVRPFTVAAFAAAAGFVVEGAISLAHHVGDDHWDAIAQSLNAAFIVAIVASAIALPYVGRAIGVGRVGRVGVAVAQVGCAAMTVESIVSGVHGGNVLGGVFFGGVILMTLGLLTLAVDGARAGTARWPGPLLLVSWIVSIGGGEHGGSIVLGLVWVVLATGVVRPRRLVPA